MLVVGAGGLGCPALQYLAAAGVGTITIVDSDHVSLHNLHRQVLFTSNDIGQLKADVAAKRLRQMNPEIEVISCSFRLTNKNALDLIGTSDLVLDATDNFATRYLINDACVLLNKPLVYGAIAEFEGQVAVFNVGENGVNYRDLFPEPPLPGSVLNCAEAGVIGVLPGIIGTLQATEVIKLLAGIGKPLLNQFLTYNALTNESFVFSLAKKEDTVGLLPKTEDEFRQRDYEWLCEAPGVKEVEAGEFDALLQQPNVAVIDVREEQEVPSVNEFPHRQWPLSRWTEEFPSVDEETVVLFCQSGKRSLEAARRLSATFGSTKKIYSLRGGITNWLAHGKKEA